MSFRHKKLLSFVLITSMYKLDHSMYSTDIKSTREVTLMQSCAPKIFLSCELCATLQRATVAWNSVLHHLKFLFILQSNNDMDPLMSLRSIISKLFLLFWTIFLEWAFLLFLFHYPYHSWPLESRITGVLADNRLQRPFTDQVFN